MLQIYFIKLTQQLTFQLIIILKLYIIDILKNMLKIAVTLYLKIPTYNYILKLYKLRTKKCIITLAPGPSVIKNFHP